MTAAKISVPRRVNSFQLERMLAATHRPVLGVELHWTGLDYGAPAAAYHVNIDRGGRVCVFGAGFDAPRSGLPGTAARRLYTFSVALCGGAGAKFAVGRAPDLGSSPPTEAQLLSMAACAALACRAFGLSVTPQTVFTHAEAAAASGFGPAHGDSLRAQDLWLVPTPSSRFLQNAGLRADCLNPAAANAFPAYAELREAGEDFAERGEQKESAPLEACAAKNQTAELKPLAPLLPGGACVRALAREYAELLAARRGIVQVPPRGKNFLPQGEGALPCA